MESRIFIEDYDLKNGYARGTYGYNDIDFAFTQLQAFEAAVDLDFINAPIDADKNGAVYASPAFPGQMMSDGNHKQLTIPLWDLLKELSGDQRTEVAKLLAVQQFELHI
jgi:hypothetical protein